MILELSELREHEIQQMTREQLIETLLGHSNYFSVRLTAKGVQHYSTDELRRLLIEVEEHSRGKA